ncbi:uncharacterized protein [Nicotiana tomentosiformis]|uniref:uncharacterized protein n=1 Tax=Nicotiana tomentosiformis TaxID=4098 RepID=UPI0008787C34|nr:uncharacterized protein LOC104093678 [Nicotiana tomentosiformis]
MLKFSEKADLQSFPLLRHLIFYQRMADSNNLEETLKPFYQRASEAEERLARLDISVASKTDSRIEELERTVAELQSKLKDVTAELKAEKEKAHKQEEERTSENAKLKYQIKHLVRNLEEALSKLASK